MSSLTIPYNKLVAAQELISDAIHDLDSQPGMDDFVMVLTWVRGDVAAIIKKLEKEGEE